MIDYAATWPTKAQIPAGVAGSWVPWVLDEGGKGKTGVLGELLHAKLTGRLSAIKPELQRLRADAGFFIDAGIEQFILLQAGECGVLLKRYSTANTGYSKFRIT